MYYVSRQCRSDPALSKCPCQIARPNEELCFRVDLREHEFAHAVKDSLGRAYNRIDHLNTRTEMLLCWEYHFDQLVRGRREEIKKKKELGNGRRD